MKYCSTRGYAVVNESYTAITQGLADDGGLFVPMDIPKMDINELFSLNISYNEMANKVLSQFLFDYGDETLKSCISNAYNDSFDHPLKTPLKKLDNDTYVLELWHGPTAAFKDMALQLLPHLLVEGKKKQQIDEETIILVATSGDTGKAALEGFKDVKGTKVITFYPKDGVAKLQELQMNSQRGDNVYVIAVEGNFDDTQTGVKTLFSDKALKEVLKQQDKAFSSANSINFGRLCPQIVYYFYSYAQLVEQRDISIGQKVDFVVPTGNFGNILAGWYAKQMGLPVGKLVCASNSNNVLTNFLSSGTYDTNREFFKTVSPSMDILISSNLERLLYEFSGRDSKTIRGLMDNLKENGKYKVCDMVIKKINEEFLASWTSEKDTAKTIQKVFEKYNYLLDTHTAVAFDAIEKIPETGNKKIVLSTASPYKFPDSVLIALNIAPSDDSFENIEMLSKTTNTNPPSCLDDLKNLPIRHTKSSKVYKMKETLLEILDQ